MKTSLNSSQQLRNEIQSLVQARESLDKNADISGSMVKITHTLHSLKPLMARQTQYIKNFLQGNEINDSTSKQSQSRRYLARICDINLNQMNELLTSAESYFSLDIKTSWSKLRNQYEKALIAEKELNEKSNLLQFLFHILNLRDKVIKQFFKSIIYRKCLLWKDLNIASTGFVHFQKNKITKSIEDYILNKKFAPTKPFFVLPTFTTPGLWSLNKNQYEDSSLSQFFKLLNEEVEDVYGTIRNYSGLNEEQRNNQDIKRNEEHVRSLRGEIEHAHISYQLLERKYRDAISKDEKLDIVEMKEKLRIAEEMAESKDQELKKARYEYRDHTRDMNIQKDKIKELEADLQKINGIEMKKLKQIELLQFTLVEELNRLDKNMSSFGSMFQFESEGKKNLAQQIINLKDKIEKLAVILGRHKNDNMRLKEEIKRLNLVIIELGLQIDESVKRKSQER